MTQPPKTLNGYPVIAKHQNDDETWVIMAFRDNNEAHPYVVSLWSIHSPASWVQGHYFDHVGKAARDFESMCKGF